LNIPDKGAFNSDLASLCGVATAQNPLSLILADVDHFKNVNDGCGYLVGDEVLKQVAQALATACTHKGTVYRWGGEELAVLLQNYSLAEAEVLAERLRSEVAGIQREANPRTITASFGVSTFPEVVSESDGLFQSANEALQGAKRNGRNQVRTMKVATRPRGNIPVTQQSLSVFMRTDESVRKLDEAIASACGQPLDVAEDASFHVHEKAKALEIATIEEIADLVRKSSEVIRKMARCFVHTTPVPAGYCISFALDVAAARRGHPVLRSYFESLRLSNVSGAYATEFLETLALLDAVG